MSAKIILPRYVAILDKALLKYLSWNEVVLPVPRTYFAPLMGNINSLHNNQFILWYDHLLVYIFFFFLIKKEKKPWLTYFSLHVNRSSLSVHLKSTGIENTIHHVHSRVA